RVVYKQLSPAVVPCFTRPSVPLRRSIALSPPPSPSQILHPACLRLSCGIFVVIADCKTEANMRRLSLFVAVVLCLPALATAQTKETIIPAGTLLQCTLDEPNFSSASAEMGDPVICHARGVQQFGHAMFPRGAYLAGRLVDSKDPGHFWGKGWLKLEFDRIS